MDPTWTRCPQCIREGRDGRLVAAASTPPAPGLMRTARVPAEALAQAPTPVPGIPMPRAEGMAQAAPPIVQAAAPPPPIAQAAAPPPPPPAPAEPAPVIQQTMPPADAPPVAPPQPWRPEMAEPPRPAPVVDRPASSVGGTVVIRRRPRALAYLIEKEGEQVGRVFQLEHDITDIGRDPRNHVVVSDVLVSGFHARIERTPAGGYAISDRGSTNGSRLNGEPLASPRPMSENDELGIGNTSLVLKVVS